MKKKIEIHAFQEVNDDWKVYSSVTVTDYGRSVLLNFERENDIFQVEFEPEAFDIFKKQYADLQNDEAACCMEEICLSVPDVDVDHYTCCWLTFTPQILSYHFNQINSVGEAKSFSVFYKDVQKLFDVIEEVLWR